MGGVKYLLLFLIMNASTVVGKVDVVVAKDGSGNYTTIQQAIDGAGERSYTSRRYVIRVKQGIYTEYVNVGHKSNNIMILGDGMRKTFITNKSNGTRFRTSETATFVTTGDGLVLKYLTIRNTARPQMNQAVALRSTSDKDAF